MKVLRPICPNTHPEAQQSPGGTAWLGTASTQQRKQCGVPLWGRGSGSDTAGLGLALGSGRGGRALTVGHHNQRGLLDSGTLTWAQQDGIKVQPLCGEGVSNQGSVGMSDSRAAPSTHHTGGFPDLVGVSGCGCPN